LDEVRRALGFELFAYLQADDPGLLSDALEATTDRNVAECHVIADPELSPVVLTYGDIACKQRLLHSPQFLRAEFFPRLKRLNDAWHEHGFKCLFHSDGLLTDVMDDLIATGIDGLNPCEPHSHMDVADVRAKYPRLVLWGGVDNACLLVSGTTQEVHERVEYLRDFGKAGGLMIGSTGQIHPGCRLENLIAMIETARGGTPASPEG